ncbi:hypothetical protein GCM10010517_57880 [Streptosporangium fragile]|uniref:Uncharacterized protein n=1 Tax=Streptosporangium fragile TaxID=46186 RepID=A0ABN3W6X7_9ACTN
MADDTHQADANHGGKASSWLAVTVILLGFTIAGVALCLGPNWFMFWMGAAVCALGGILLLAFRVFQDVVLDAPRTMHAGTNRDMLS